MAQRPLVALAGHSSTSPPSDSPLAPRWHFTTPAAWAVSKEGTLTFTSDKGTDFWQRTHYGFRNDNGHFLAVKGYPEAGKEGIDYVMNVGIKWKAAAKYDQAGFYIRASASCWAKFSCEYEAAEFPAGLGGVVTNSGYSDWSFAPVANDTNKMYYRLRRRGPNYIVHASADGKTKWTQLRLFRLSEDDGVTPLDIGIYAASPIEGGMTVEVFEWTMEEAKQGTGWDPYYDD
ncbi:hypothetical protein DFJ74DRAFT_648546 [Hyaloraphidium curvatum]|nr:hypothetical protein DFJ74DRAFT_648546 [Hyaloraphidium curvatum]